MKFNESVAFLFLFGIVVHVDATCVLSLHDDFGSPSPVFLRRGTYLSSGDDPRGDIVLKRADTVVAACPGKNNAVVLGNDTTDLGQVEVQCVTNKTFRAGRWSGRFAEVSCSRQPWFSSEDIGVCHGGRRNYRVGYKIQNEFYSLYEACFDGNILNTLYVKHRVTPSSHFFQTGGARPNFVEGGLFGKTRISKLYKNQKSQINALLGEGMDEKYVTKAQFLTRGHLAPRADFSLRAEQRASFHYVNSAPQWLRGNAGDWAALEEAVRRIAQSRNLTLSLYTGTHGVLTLPDSKGRLVELYLSTDENNNLAVPVPLYFYKIVHEPRSKTATTFVSINSSFYNQSTIEDLMFCRDICEDNPQFSWLRWRNDNTTSFCCEYKEFTKTIDYLPRLDVKGDFY